MDDTRSKELAVAQGRARRRRNIGALSGLIVVGAATIAGDVGWLGAPRVGGAVGISCMIGVWALASVVARRVYYADAADLGIGKEEARRAWRTLW